MAEIIEQLKSPQLPDVPWHVSTSHALEGRVYSSYRLVAKRYR
ncbi:hypothetical protein [Coleofasciculus sp. E1-EBD-02]